MGNVRPCEVLFAVILISVWVSSTPVAEAGEETTKLQQDTESDIGGYYSEDPYLYECYKDCKTARSITTCLKYRVLRFLHEKTSAVQDHEPSEAKVVMTLGRMNLVALPHARSDTAYTLELSEYRSKDSDITKMFKFALREMARFARSYTVTFSKKNKEDNKNPRLIGETLINGAIGERRAGRTKLKVALLLPLLYFLHLKALLVPILLGVIFIKKVVILGAIFLLAVVKLRKHHPHHNWEAVIVYHPEISSVHHGHVSHLPDVPRGHVPATDEGSWEGNYSDTDLYQKHVTDTGQWNRLEYPPVSSALSPFYSWMMPANTYQGKPALVSYTSHDGSLEGNNKEPNEDNSLEAYQGQVNPDQGKYPRYVSKEEGLQQNTLMHSINLRKKPWLAPYTPNGCHNTWNSVHSQEYSDNHNAKSTQKTSQSYESHQFSLSK